MINIIRLCNVFLSVTPVSSESSFRCVAGEMGERGGKFSVKRVYCFGGRAFTEAKDKERVRVLPYKEMLIKLLPYNSLS